MGSDAGTDAIIERAVTTLKSLGAVVVDSIRFPAYLIGASPPIYNELVSAEFRVQITEYLHTLKPGFPRTFEELIEKATDPAVGYRSPEKVVGLKFTGSFAREMDDPEYLAIKTDALGAIRAGVASIFSRYHLDAIVYPSAPCPAAPIPEPAEWSERCRNKSLALLASESGFPDLVVPAGMTMDKDPLPVSISFLGLAFSEPKLIGYGYDFEHATHGTVQPKYTPALPSETFTYSSPLSQ